MHSHDQGRYLLTGAGGVLGLGLAAASPDGVECLVAGRRPPPFWAGQPFVAVDLEVPGRIAALVERWRPRAVLHAAAWSRISDCEAAPARAWRVNVGAVEELLQATRRRGTRVILISSDQVFPGSRGEADPPYQESDRAGPALHVYGRSKAAAEGLVVEAGGVVARLPLLLGALAGPGRCGADVALLAALERGERPRLYVDEVRCPVAARLAAPALWELLLGERHAGVFHLAGASAVSRYQLGQAVCAAAGVAPRFAAASAAAAPGPPRPRRLVLASERARRELGWPPPDLQQSLAHLRLQP